jgi:hypothetical protein
VETGREVRRLEGHTGLVTGLAFSPEGKRALSCGYDQLLILWDLETGREVRGVTLPLKYVHCVAFLPDGKRALLGADKLLILWDVDEGKEVRRLDGHTDAVISVAVASTGKHALTGSDDRTLRLWDLEGKEPAKVFRGHAGPVKTVAFSPDGKHVLSGSSDATVRLWEVAGGKEIAAFTKHAEPVVSVAFGSDGRHTLSGSSDSVIHVWGLAKALGYAPTPDPAPVVPERPVQSELKPTAVVPVGGTIGNLLLAPNGKALYYLNAADGKLGRIDLTTLKRDRELPLAEGVETVVIPPKGKFLYALAAKMRGPGAAEGTIQVIDPGKLEVLKNIVVEADPYDGAATDAGLVFISGGGSEWSEVSVVDTVRADGIVARYGGVWNRSLLRLSAAQDRLFLSTQGVSPGSLETLLIPSKIDDKPVQYKAPADGKHPLGGGFVVSPDGQFLLCKTGTVLRLSTKRDDDLKPVANVGPFLTAVLDGETRSVLLLTADGTLTHLSTPDFQVRGRYRLGAVAYQATLDGKQGRLYVAAVDPQTLADRPRGRGVGDVYVYDVREMLRGKAK